MTFHSCSLLTKKVIWVQTTPFAGLFVKKADPEVLKDLDAQRTSL